MDSCKARGHSASWNLCGRAWRYAAGREDVLIGPIRQPRSHTGSLLGLQITHGPSARRSSATLWLTLRRTFSLRALTLVNTPERAPRVVHEFLDPSEGLIEVEFNSERVTTAEATMGETVRPVRLNTKPRPAFDRGSSMSTTMARG